MIHNLTDKQLRVLKWIVEQVEAGEIEESFTVRRIARINQGGPKELSVGGKDAPDFVDIGSLDVLVSMGFLVHSPSSYKYTLIQKAYEVAAPKGQELKRIQLRDALLNHFNENELEDLCFELDVNYEDLPGSARPQKVRELISYFERLRPGRVQTLETYVREKRPHAFDGM